MIPVLIFEFKIEYQNWNPTVLMIRIRNFSFNIFPDSNIWEAKKQELFKNQPEPYRLVF